MLLVHHMTLRLIVQAL